MESVAAARKGNGPDYLPFIARAAVEALRAFPAVNARIDGNGLIFNDASTSASPSISRSKASSCR